MVLKHQLFYNIPTVNQMKDHWKFKNSHHLLVTAWSQLPEQEPDDQCETTSLQGPHSHTEINGFGCLYENKYTGGIERSQAWFKNIKWKLGPQGYE